MVRSRSEFWLLLGITLMIGVRIQGMCAVSSALVVKKTIIRGINSVTHALKMTDPPNSSEINMRGKKSTFYSYIRPSPSLKQILTFISLLQKADVGLYSVYPLALSYDRALPYYSSSVDLFQPSIPTST